MQPHLNKPIILVKNTITKKNICGVSYVISSFPVERSYLSVTLCVELNVASYRDTIIVVGGDS